MLGLTILYVAFMVAMLNLYLPEEGKIGGIISNAVYIAAFAALLPHEVAIEGGVLLAVASGVVLNIAVFQYGELKYRTLIMPLLFSAGLLYLLPHTIAGLALMLLTVLGDMVLVTVVMEKCRVCEQDIT